MSVAVCAISSTSALVSITMQAPVIPEITNPPHEETEEEAPEQLDVWASIQAQKSKQAHEPYTHPLRRQSSGLLSQKSLETCTESLGSETGSENFLSSDHEEKEYRRNLVHGVKKTTSVNNHCSGSKRSSLPRSFPPPLSSILQQDGPQMQMRTHRRDGRLFVDAVSIKSHNCFHAERHNGRLLLSFLNTASTKSCTQTHEVEDEEEVEEIEQEEEEEEEEVEVVDRGTIVEVKVSTQPQQMAGKAASKKVHRSSIVINKFVSCTTAADDVEKYGAEILPPATQMKRSSATTTTTAAAAAVAASSVSENISADEGNSSMDNKLLFTSKKKNKEELLHDIKRCSELRKPLFIWEPCCIATSS